MSYFQPGSLTWWSGIFSVILGVASMALPESMALTELGRVIAMLAGSGDASPASLILLGTGMVGIRAKLERTVRGEP